jgi:hypothetical protein
MSNEKVIVYPENPREQAEEAIANLAYESMMKDLTIQQMQNDQANLTYQLMMKGVL